MAAHPRLAPALGPASAPAIDPAIDPAFHPAFDPAGDGRVRTPRGLGGRYVVVDGAGPLASAVAALLRLSGVGRVRAGPWAADTVDAELRQGGSAAPDLLVHLADRSVDPRAAEPWRGRDVPQLPVVTDTARVVVGPWVHGDPALPCLGCLHLLRTSRDLPGSVAAAPGPTLPTIDEPLVTLAAGMTAMVVVAGLDGGAIPAGVSVEVGGPWPRVEHRRWDRHTDCPNHDVRETGVVRHTREDSPWRTGRHLDLGPGQAVRVAR
jgi:hypothetical protein